MSDLTEEDWGKIHAKVWTDPHFRTLLETDPTAAIKQYAHEAGKTIHKIVTVPERPPGISDIDLHHYKHPPVACC